MSYFKGRLVLPGGAPVVPPGRPHNCFFPTGWNRPYSHATVAVILTNSRGQIAAVVERQPNEPAEGGKLALPGGYVELGQRVIDAARTEVLEETGYSIKPGTLTRFALLDGPMSVPGRANEHDYNTVTVFSAQADRKVQEHDDEVTAVIWIGRNNMPPRSRVAFGHYDIMGMWFRHLRHPFSTLPIVPSEMNRRDLLPARW